MDVTEMAVRNDTERSKIKRKTATGIKSLAGMPYFSMRRIRDFASSIRGLRVYSRKAPMGLGSTDTCKDVVLPDELEVFTVKLEALSRVLAKAHFLSHG